MKIFVLLLSLASIPAQPEPTGLQRRISLELKEVAADKLFEILGEVGAQRFVVSPEVAKLKVTLKFHNVPVRMVLDGVAAQLGVRYRSEGESMIVELGAASDEVATLRARIVELEKELAGCSAK